MKNNLQGGKADRLSVKDIAKKHDVSTASIEAQIKMGKKVEMEHVDDAELAVEIAMDHLEEIPDYYTRLNKMEKDAKKELSLESRRMMALAGIKEGDKRFLKNESFQEKRSPFGGHPITVEDIGKALEETKKDNDFIVFELDQKHFEPGQDDDNLYKLG